MHFSPQNFCRQVLKLAGKSYASAAKVSNDLKIVVGQELPGRTKPIRPSLLSDDRSLVAIAASDSWLLVTRKPEAEA